MSDEMEKKVNSDLIEEETAAAVPEPAEVAQEAAAPEPAEVPEEAAVSEELAPSEAASSADKGLTPEHIGHLLQVLGDDIINDMLENAGLTHEDLNNVLEEEPADGEAESESADEAAEAVKKPAAKKPRRKGSAKRRFLFAVIFVLIILMVAALNKIFMSVTINSNDPIQYSEHADEISADEGSLNVNNVSVTVPTTGTEEYSISYSWSEEDDKYPSVPHAITAIYTDEEGNKLYSISLYRNETIPKKNVKKGKKASNWFDDWAPVAEGDVLQTPVKSGDINGFYIYPKPSDDETVSEYNDYSYYFAVKEDDGISVYVIEGVCLDETRNTEFRMIMDNSIHSISIK